MCPLACPQGRARPPRWRRCSVIGGLGWVGVQFQSRPVGAHESRQKQEVSFKSFSRLISQEVPQTSCSGVWSSTQVCGDGDVRLCLVCYLYHGDQQVHSVHVLPL